MKVERGKALKKEMLISVSIFRRFWKYVEIQENGCWNWVGYVWQWYGYFHAGKKHRLAHRVSYVLFVGNIASRKDIHHKCLNSLCVNPNHLEQLNRKEHSKIHAETN